MAEKVCPECKQCAEWLNTYGDFVTLLLTFFVLLYSFSSMRTEEFKRGMGSLKGAFGVLPKENALIQKPYTIIPQLTNLQESEVQNSIVKLEEQASDLQLTESVKLQVTEKGVNINISDPVMFDKNRAELKPRILPVLNLVAELTRDWPNKIIIEGHTDNSVVKTTQFPSNWELSAARALNVLHYFEDNSGIEPWRLTAVGYGKHHPIAPNDTEENKAKNRRIEIHIEYTGEAPPAAIPVGK